MAIGDMQHQQQTISNYIIMCVFTAATHCLPMGKHNCSDVLCQQSDNVHKYSCWYLYTFINQTVQVAGLITAVEIHF